MPRGLSRGCARVLDELEDRIVGVSRFYEVTRERKSLYEIERTIILMYSIDIQQGDQNILQRKGGVQNEQHRHVLNNKCLRKLCHTNNFFAPSIASHTCPAFMSFFAVDLPISGPKVPLAD